MELFSRNIKNTIEKGTLTVAFFLALNTGEIKAVNFGDTWHIITENEWKEKKIPDSEVDVVDLRTAKDSEILLVDNLKMGRIFIDRSGNTFYWVNSIMETLYQERIKELKEKFLATYSIKLPYNQIKQIDGIWQDEDVFYKPGSLHPLILRDSKRNKEVFVPIDTDNNSLWSFLDALFEKKESEKTEALIKFLRKNTERNFKSSTEIYEYLKDFYVNKAPEAINKLEEYVPFPIEQVRAARSISEPAGKNNSGTYIDKTTPIGDNKGTSISIDASELNRKSPDILNELENLKDDR